MRAGSRTIRSDEESESEAALSSAVELSVKSVRSTISGLMLEEGGRFLFTKNGDSDALSCAARRLARCLLEDNCGTKVTDSSSLSTVTISHEGVGTEDGHIELDGASSPGRCPSVAREGSRGCDS